MDQPRPRPDPRLRPLIISHPELQSPLRRVFAFALTLAAWVVWVLALLPVVWAIAARLGLHMPPLKYYRPADSMALDLLFDTVPLALLLVLSGFGVLLVNGFIVRMARATRKAPVTSAGMTRLVTGVAVDPTELAIRQAARIVQVEHDAHGSMLNVRVLKSGATPKGNSP